MSKELEKTVFAPNKMFAHEAIRDAAREGGDALMRVWPVTAELGPSGPENCNSFCGWCNHRGHYNESSNMDLGFYKSLLDQLKAGGTKAVIYSASGEPSVNPDIHQFITYTGQQGIHVSMITNGTLMQKRDDMRSALLDDSHGTSRWTRVSLNAGTVETRQKVHGTYDFDLVIRGITTLATENAQRNGNLGIGAQLVIDPVNQGEIGEAARVLQSTGVEYMQVKPVIFHPNDGNPQLPPAFWQKVMDDTEDAKAKYETDAFRIHNKVDQFRGLQDPALEQDSYSKCLAHFLPIIEPNGEVYYCSQTRGIPEFMIGNLSESTFAEIWASQQRQDVTDGIHVPACQPLCRNHGHNKALHAVQRGELDPDDVAKQLSEDQGLDFI